LGLRLALLVAEIEAGLVVVVVDVVVEDEELVLVLLDLFLVST
jgi:hypothetical protein